ncbi:MAG: hypothetical protein JXR23_03365 [Pontiellaceae bacterium]|nr:hypothetical protein [Pontiellaceae bacterium]
MLKNLKTGACILAAGLPLVTQGIERKELLPEKQGPQIQIGNYSDFQEMLDQAALNDLRADTRFQNCYTAFSRKIETMLGEGKLPLGVQLLYAQLPFLKGEVELISDEKGFYLAAAMDEAAYEESLKRSEWLQEKLDTDIIIKKVTFREQEIIQYISGADPEHPYWKAQLKDTLLLSTDREWLESSIVRLSKEKVDATKLSGVRAVIPVQALIRSSIENETEPEKRAAKEKLYSALGLLGIGDCSISIDETAEGFAVDFNLEVSDLKKGIFRLLETSPRTPLPKGLIPDEVTSISVGRLTLNGLWKELPSILSNASMETALQFSALLQQIKALTGADLENDVFAHLGSTYYTYSTLQNTNQRWVAALELNNGPALQQTLGTILSAPQMQSIAAAISGTDFRGKTIYTLTQDAGKDHALALCATDQLLLLGNLVNVRESILRMNGNANRGSADLLTESLKLAPKNAFIYGATNHKKTTALLSARLSDHSFNIFFGVRSKNGSPMEEELEENEISLNYIGSFLHTSYYYTEKTDTGLHHHILLRNQKD